MLASPLLVSPIFVVFLKDVWIRTQRAAVTCYNLELMLSRGANVIMRKLMLSYGKKCYHVGPNFIIWSLCYHLGQKCYQVGPKAVI